MFLLVQENIQHRRIVLKPKISNLSPKVSLCFPSVVNSLAVWTNKLEDIVNELRKEKGVRYKPQNLPTIPTIYHNHEKPLTYPIPYGLQHYLDRLEY